MPAPATVAASDYDWVVVGAGFAGAVLAERIASELDQRVLVLERRSHIAGNAYDFRDETGLLVHRYGPHIFHTNSDKVWDYLSRFTAWRPYEHRVLAVIDGQQVPVPFNFTSIERSFPAAEAARLIERLTAEFGSEGRVPVLRLRTHDDPAIRAFADYVYEKVFRNYTLKQWELSPEQLDPSVTARVPIRLSYDDRYFQDRHQAMPAAGYTALFERLLDHPRITVRLGTDFEPADMKSHPGARLIYTGPIDAYFDYRFGPLPYRSLRFISRHLPVQLAQPTGSLNFPNDFAYTRITEMKHITGDVSDHTVLVEEYPEAFSHGRNEPYYPIPSPHTADLLRPYTEAAKALAGQVWFTGRLGDYRYYNMDQVCAQSLTLFEREIAPAAARAR